MTRTRSSRKRSNDDVPGDAGSPTTIKYRKIQERSMQQQAFQELLVLRSANGGIVKRGDYKLIANRFKHRGYDCVTKSNLRYRLKLMKTTGDITMITETRKPTANLVLEENSDISPLTMTGIEEVALTITDAEVAPNNEETIVSS